MSENETMRKLINLVESTQVGEMVSEGEVEVERFTKDKVVNMQELKDEFGEDQLTQFADVFKNGKGVYKIFSGSRGYLEDVTFLGTSPEFTYETYPNPHADEPEDEDMFDPHDFDGGYDEFTEPAWDRQFFSVGLNEEEYEVYTYWSGN